MKSKTFMSGDKFLTCVHNPPSEYLFYQFKPSNRKHPPSHDLQLLFDDQILMPHVAGYLNFCPTNPYQIISLPYHYQILNPNSDKPSEERSRLVRSDTQSLGQFLIRTLSEVLKLKRPSQRH